ncbi:MAG: hypothetical protein J6V62_06970 [Paludibacteraceae bacterium]|nr:hypothetical protein [Paludibacteraceae bacterium]
MKKAAIISIIVLCSLGLLLALPFVALRIAITPSVRSELLKMVVPEYAHAEVEIGDMDYTLFSTWPHVSLTLNKVVVYSNVLTPKDTLLCADSLHACINVGDFLSNDELRICNLYLGSPRVFARTTAQANNWDVMLPSEPDTTASSPLPPVYVDTLCLADGAIFYQNDTAHYQASVQQIQLNGQAVYTPLQMRALLQMNIDSIAYNEQPANAHYAIHQFSLMADASMHADSVALKAKIDAPQVTMSDSLLAIVGKPLQLQVEAKADTTYTKFAIDKCSILFDETELSADGLAHIYESDSTYYVDANVRMHAPKLEKILTVLPKNLSPYFKGIRLSGGVEAEAAAKGFYGNKQLPSVQASLALNNLKGSAKGRKEKIDRLQLNAKAAYHPNSKDSTYLKIENFIFKSGQSHLNLQADAKYKQKREHWDLRFKGHLNLKELNELYPFYERSRVKGLIDADINAQFYLSDLLQKKIYHLHSQSTLTGDDVFVNIPQARTFVKVDSLRASLFTNTGVKFGRRSSRIDTSLVNARISFSDMSVRNRRNVRANIERLSASFLADDLSGNKAPRLRVSLSCKGFDGVANDTLIFKAKRAMVSTSVMPNREHTFVPTGAVRFYFDSLLWSSPKAGMVLDSTSLTFDATPRFRTHKKVGNKRVKIQDSDQKVINLDSLYQIGMKVANSSQMSEDYLKHFTSKGHLYLKSFRMRDPYFPLRTSLTKVDIDFNDDTLHLDDLRLRMGRSNIRLSGQVDNIRRFLMYGRTLHADLQLKSRRLDINQLLRAANTAVESMPADSLVAQDNALLAEADTLGLYDETQDMAVDSLSGVALVVLPKNLDLRFNAQIDTVLFSKMKLADFTGNVRVKDQVMSIANLSTSTQVGKAAMHVSYTCKDVKNADVAVAVDMDSVQIGSLVYALPELDSIMPMLRSFDGSVACELSANAQLDSAMNIQLPTVNAGAWLRGDSLVLMDGETFTEIAKMLMFSKKTRNIIDSVSVELLVKNNEIEIFPFMVSMDKYRLGVGGTQGISGNFDFHIALLKPIRAGLDVYGTNYDNMKFRLTSAKFKDGKTVIGKGGYLLREEDVDIRQNFHDKVIKEILEDNK